MNIELSKWQSTWMQHFDDDLYIACTAISAGKTRVLSIWLVMQCVNKPGLRGIIVAQTHSALKKVLIHDIIMFASLIGVHIEWNKSSQELTFDNGSTLFGFSSENPTGVLGMSEIDILAVDEAAYCSEEIYNYARDRMRGGKYEPMVRLISSPSTMERVQNWFSRVVKENPDKVIHATYKDNPFTSEKFKKELDDRYGVGTNIWRQQCLGEIFDTDVASQIIFRNEFPDKKKDLSDTGRWLGADFAGTGADNNAYVVIDGYGMLYWNKHNQQNTFQKSQTLRELYTEWHCQRGAVDNTGNYGAGALDLVSCNKDLTIDGVNFAQAAYNPDIYPQARTEMYLELAKTIRDGFWVCDEVKEELLAQGVAINKRGQQQLLPKEDVKKILGHSPDLCDALALAVYAMNHESEIHNLTPAESLDVALRFVTI